MQKKKGEKKLYSQAYSNLTEAFMKKQWNKRRKQFHLDSGAESGNLFLHYSFRNVHNTCVVSQLPCILLFNKILIFFVISRYQIT